MSYLKEVVADVLENFSDSIENVVFVTSGKRPALFLKKYFAQLNQKAGIAPEFIGISDLFSRISGVESLSGLPLLFEFYETYLSVCKKEPDDFETFIGWGQTLLKDFSEIDQYLVPPEKIFPYIHALKEAEHWSGADELTEMQKKHLEFWNTLGDYYFAFNEKLSAQNKGYSGFIAKKAVEKLPHYLQNNSHKIHIFVGFNALSKAEQKIIHSILMDSQSEIYWDIDRHFIQSEEHDAGYFIRKYLKNWKYYDNNEPKLISNNYLQQKNIHITGVPRSVNQAHSVAELLKKDNNNWENTALIVADENLLIPVLQSVSSEKSVNITMGYPLQQTPLNDLFVAFFRLHLAKSFHYKDVLNLITQPFLRNLLTDKGVNAITDYIKEHNINYLTREKILKATPQAQQEIIKTLFPEKDENFINKLIDNALSIIYSIKENAAKTEASHVLMLEYAYRFYLLFNQLKQLQRKFGYINSVKSLYHFYLEVLQKSSLNFMGEPLEGLQVMGVLESRSLDFENVIITSVNEGVLPLGKSGNSLIPYDVKYYLELPTYKERDAVYSYNFYRILQRASNIHLFYDTETNSLKSKEKSRFVLQLLAEKIPTHHIVHQVKAPEVYPVTLPKISINKTDDVINRLKELAENGISPSALTTYILNPITFYQQYVLKIYEERDVEETVEARTFGDIVHATLEALYQSLLNQPLTEANFKEMRPKVRPLIEEHFAKKYQESEFKIGKNLLIFNVIEEYIHRFLDFEAIEVKNGTEIVVLHLEQKSSVMFSSEKMPFPVYLKGIIDRIDMRNGTLHIIDYKTGRVENSNVSISDWDLLITDFKYSKAFQLLSYAYIFKQQFDYQQNIIAGNFSFKKINDGLIKFHIKEGREKWYEITPEIIEIYKTYTEKLLLEIFDQQIPFSSPE
ncbi:PD-(D/E)XK nuclease family protein [Capnocytophaga sp.]|uniref:PD-(D/E)XK nuclease family protein n=1 Tax=Capnocytophaga sp. TaxID=44737 RepID=UPI0026DBA50D|nr:PD-(D/E)XK nuclease family protein [Capnocytophaga sp.]MDO5104820.1 PD-(D/E)XK nuclease family protein [Capnocytophaga sp.]